MYVEIHLPINKPSSCSDFGNSIPSSMILFFFFMFSSISILLHCCLYCCIYKLKLFSSLIPATFELNDLNYCSYVYCFGSMSKHQWFTRNYSFYSLFIQWSLYLLFHLYIVYTNEGLIDLNNVDFFSLLA